MSYDTWLEIDTGGPEPAMVTDGRNYTSNVWMMWEAALGEELSNLDKRRARDCVGQLKAAVWYMYEHADELRNLNPSNGWGCYEGALEYLEDLHKECVRHPKAQVRVHS